MSDDLIFFNGLNGATGGYDLPPMTGLELAGFIRGERPPENLAELRYRYELSVQRHLGLREGVNPLRIEETGWGVIFAHGADPAIAEALAPLIDHRRAQAGNLFRLFTDEGGQAYRPGESSSSFSRGTALAPVPPTRLRCPTTCCSWATRRKSPTSSNTNWMCSTRSGAFTSTRRRNTPATQPAS